MPVRDWDKLRRLDPTRLILSQPKHELKRRKLRLSTSQKIRRAEHIRRVKAFAKPGNSHFLIFPAPPQIDQEPVLNPAESVDPDRSTPTTVKYLAPHGTVEPTAPSIRTTDTAHSLRNGIRQSWTQSEPVIVPADC